MCPWANSGHPLAGEPRTAAGPRAITRLCSADPPGPTPRRLGNHGPPGTPTGICLANFGGWSDALVVAVSPLAQIPHRGRAAPARPAKLAGLTGRSSGLQQHRCEAEGRRATERPGAGLVFAIGNRQTVVPVCGAPGGAQVVGAAGVTPQHPCGLLVGRFVKGRLRENERRAASELPQGGGQALAAAAAAQAMARSGRSRSSAGAASWACRFGRSSLRPLRPPQLRSCQSAGSGPAA